MDKDTLIYFEKYNQSLENAKTHLKSELPRNLRLFNIRLRLALDMKIDFKGEISLTKTKQVRNTYGLLIKMIECWNVYEVLFHYIKENNKHSKLLLNVDNEIFKNILSESHSITILKETIEKLKIKFNSDDKFYKDFIQIIKRIENDPRLSKVLKLNCKNTLSYFDGNTTIFGTEIIALIYTERNMYYHNGETAKMGMSYSNRQFLIQTLTTGFIKHILLLSKYVIEKEIDKLNK